MGDGVQMKVEQRVAHRGDVADLTGKVEDDVCIGHGVADNGVADLGIDDLDLETLDVATVTTMAIDQCIDDAHVGAAPHEFVTRVGTNEPEATGHYAHGGRQIVARGHSPDDRERAKIDEMDDDEYERMVAAGERHWWYRSTRTLLQMLVTPHLAAVDGGTIYLDAGGGSGATGSWLADRATTLLDDFEPVALKAAVHDHAGYRAVRANINHIPHRADTFDAVICVTALCHRMNPDPQAIVNEFARVTKPGGVVCLMEPGGKRLWRGHDEVTHTARRFSRADLRSLVRGAGLDLVRATGAYSFLVPPAAVMGLVERGRNKSDVGRNESGLGGVLGHAARVERALLRKVDLPFGLSVIAIGRKPRA
jgi:ubiquinone/menaquinone biosynthesis C-methylase UbiE